MGADEFASNTPEGATGSEITTGTVLAALEAQNNKFEGRLLVEAPMEDDSRTLVLAKATVNYGNGAQEATYTVFGINSEKGLVRMDFDARSITKPVMVGGIQADYPVEVRKDKKISPDQLTQLTKEEEMDEWSKAFKHQRDYLYAKLRTEAETRRIQSGFFKQALDTINDGISV
jgi:hypothetical protein